MINHFHEEHKRIRADVTRPVVTNPIGAETLKEKGGQIRISLSPLEHLEGTTMGI